MNSKQTLGTEDRKLNGFDAYENAWDIISKQFWSALGFNIFWFLGFFLLLIVIFLFYVVGYDESWISFIAISITLFFIFSPLWEGANILRFNATGQFPNNGKLPILKIIVARLFFLILVGFGYIIFVLPGIYLHSRLCLYLPIILRSRNISPLGGLHKSWLRTRSDFIQFYTLWIAIVFSKPVCLLPFGIGLVLERPICGIAKDLMFLRYSNYPRDGPY